MKNNHNFYYSNLNYKLFGQKYIIFIKIHVMAMMAQFISLIMYLILGLFTQENGNTIFCLEYAGRVSSDLMTY